MREGVRPVVALGVAVGLAVAAMLVVVFAPLQRSESLTTVVGGETTATSSRSSLLESQGSGIAIVAAVPVFFVLVPFALSGFRHGRAFKLVLVAFTALMFLFVLGTGFSIGLLYMPALVAMVIATALVLSVASRPRRSGWARTYSV